MNKLIKENVEDFYFGNDVIIEGKSTKTWDMDGISISLRKNDMKYIALLLSNGKYDWLIHFENETNQPYTDNEKEILFNAVADIVKPDDLLTTEGGVTPGGISGIKKLKMHGFKQAGVNKGDNVYWASDRLLDRDKFNKWIQNANEDDYIVIDKDKPLTIENTKPVVQVLEKL